MNMTNIPIPKLNILTNNPIPIRRAQFMPLPAPANRHMQRDSPRRRDLIQEWLHAVLDSSAYFVLVCAA
jgi:hypothetical protein